MRYQTKHKDKIVAYLSAHEGEHITAQALHYHFLEQGTQIGIATIYRCLDQLVADGTLRKYTIDSRTGSCYEYLSDSKESCREHFHLKCTRCDTLFHVACPHLSELNSHMLDHHGFQVDHSKTVLYGLCEVCQGARL